VPEQRQLLAEGAFLLTTARGQIVCPRVLRGRIVSIQTTAERGGAEYANVDLLAGLQDRGRDVILLTNLTDLTVGTSVPARSIHIGPKLGRRSALRLIFEAPLILVRLARALHAERPVAAVLLNFKKEQLLCSLLPRWLTGEVVWAEWGPVPPPMRRGPARVVYALAARRVRRVLAVSEGTAKTVVDTGVPVEKVLVIPDLVNLHRVAFDRDARSRARSQWGIGEDTLAVGCISRLQIRKRNDVLIDAMAHLDGDVVLLIAGEGDEEQALRARAEPFGERVRFVPNVRGHVEDFLSGCDLLAFAPSPTEADRPRVIVMAQLVGLPIVATHPEGAGVLKKSGLGTIVQPHNDPRALAAALAAYRDDRERCRREGEAARTAIQENYDPEHTLALVEEALGLT
jgi:glycosyltransferase involved in cell wall biosynthesis